MALLAGRWRAGAPFPTRRRALVVFLAVWAAVTVLMALLGSLVMALAWGDAGIGLGLVLTLAGGAWLARSL